MVTKEQCILDRVLDLVGYGNNRRLTENFIYAFNQGKQYVSDKIFPNNESGLDDGLQGLTPSEIVYSVIGEDSNYNPSDPFFVVGNGLKSIDEYDLKRMIRPEDAKRLLTSGVLNELSDSDFFDAFYNFLHENHPNVAKSLNFEQFENYTPQQFMEADWDQLIDGTVLRPVRLSESDIRKITNKVVSELKKRKKK